MNDEIIKKWDNFSKIINCSNNNNFNVVYFHAFTGSYRNKNFIINKLNNCNFYGFDMPGHGETLINDEKSISIVNYLNLAIEFIQDFNINNIVLMGHSMGGGIANSIAINPLIKNRIKKIILEAPANPASSTNYETIIKYLVPNNVDEMKLVGGELFYDPIKFFGGEKSYDRFINFEFNRLLQKKYLRKIIDITNQKILNDRCLESIKTIDIPSLLILGSDDKIIPYNESIEYFNKNSNYKICKINQTKHVPIAEKSDECIKLINEFINS